MNEILIQLNQRYQKHPAIVSREIAGELILVPIRQHSDDLDSIFTMNETGTWIWSMLDSHKTLAEIQDALVKEFEVDVEQAQQDLMELIQDLLDIEAVVKV